MKYESVFTLTLFSRLPQRLIPFKLELDDKVFEIREPEEDWRHVTAYVSGPVNSEHLYIRTGPPNLDGNEPDRGIEVPDSIIFINVLTRGLNILSFLTDVPIRYSHNLHLDRLIPETSDDQKRLEELGTETLFHAIHIEVSIRSFSDKNITKSALAELDSKEVGLALYSHALLMQEPCAIFREFWKILESAFGTKNQQLLNLLQQYPVVQELGFSEVELNALLILRGRASHAESRKGIREFVDVSSETGKTLPRLKCLIEQVILTKKDWGSRSCDVKRLTRQIAWIDKD